MYFLHVFMTLNNRHELLNFDQKQNQHITWKFYSENLCFMRYIYVEF